DDLGEEIKANMQDLIRATEVYQSFLVYLNRQEGGDPGKVIIGNPTGSGSYNIDTTLNGEADTAATAYAGGNIHVTQNYAEFVSADISSNIATGDKFEINASISLTYSANAVNSQFPARRDIERDTDYGVTVSASSNVAFSASATSYSKNTIGADESPVKMYYTEGDPIVATLDLNPLGDGVGDFTSLGINASNNDNSTEAEIDLLAVLDVSTVLAAVSGYDRVGITVTLSCKTSDGEYVNVSDITDYMSLAIEDVAPANITASGASFSLVLARSFEGIKNADGVEITMPTLEFTVKTGSTFESAGLKYSNYKIKVEVVLKNSTTGDYAVSRADNYVIYTNARVKPNYIE
ncbi:MAG: hypothetical protein J5903_01885, partial [Clostridia bacterium]|nr:hypothetical protein [Clostridia bacterium]